MIGTTIHGAKESDEGGRAFFRSCPGRTAVGGTTEREPGPALAEEDRFPVDFLKKKGAARGRLRPRRECRSYRVKKDFFSPMYRTASAEALASFGNGDM